MGGRWNSRLGRCRARVAGDFGLGLGNEASRLGGVASDDACGGVSGEETAKVIGDAKCGDGNLLGSVEGFDGRQIEGGPKFDVSVVVACDDDVSGESRLLGGDRHGANLVGARSGGDLFSVHAEEHNARGASLQVVLDDDNLRRVQHDFDVCDCDGVVGGLAGQEGSDEHEAIRVPDNDAAVLGTRYNDRLLRACLDARDVHRVTRQDGAGRVLGLFLGRGRRGRR